MCCNKKWLWFSVGGAVVILVVVIGVIAWQNNNRQEEQANIDSTPDVSQQLVERSESAESGELKNTGVEKEKVVFSLIKEEAEVNPFSNAE